MQHPFDGLVDLIPLGFVLGNQVAMPDHNVSRKYSTFLFTPASSGVRGTLPRQASNRSPEEAALPTPIALTLAGKTIVRFSERLHIPPQTKTRPDMQNAEEPSGSTSRAP